MLEFRALCSAKVVFSDRATSSRCFPTLPLRTVYSCAVSECFRLADRHHRGALTGIFSYRSESTHNGDLYYFYSGGELLDVPRGIFKCGGAGSRKADLDLDGPGPLRIIWSTHIRGPHVAWTPLLSFGEAGGGFTPQVRPGGVVEDRA